VLLIGLSAALAVEGFTHGQIGRAGTRPAQQSGPTDALGDAGPIVDLSRTPAASTHVPARRIALTFDDGPDPRWTPEILRVLARHHVHATFFVVGAKAAAHPGLVRDERAAGHELGSHTFTHADLTRVSAARRGAELSLTQTVLAGTAGVTTSLLRLPYSSTTDSFSGAQVHAAARAADRGYLLVAATKDARDWERPGVDAIVARSLPSDGDGAVILMHDAGGDRSQTVAALERVIDEGIRRGDRFVTVSQVFGQSRDAVNPAAGTAAHYRGLALLVAIAAAHLIVSALTFLLLPIGVLALVRAVIVVFFALRHVRQRRRGPAEPSFTSPVSVLVPAYNEVLTIAATVQSIVDTDAPDVEVIVIDDGSTDGTADAVDALGLPEVRVIRQSNAGKATALNAGIAASSHPIVVMVDGDTLFERDTIGELLKPFADPEVGAVSGNTKVGNRHGLLGRWQHVEYVLGFNLDRRMFDILRCMPTIPGAIGAFRRDVLEAVGGMSTDTLAEDTDVTMAVNRAGWRAVYAERARAWTEAPATIGALWRQRYRWSYGTMQAMWKHRAALREGGGLGRVGLPYVLAFQVLLPLLAPAVDVVTIYGLVFLDGRVVLLYWLLFNALSVGLGAFALWLDDESMTPLWTVVLQQFVYRQLMYLVVIQSAFTALGGHRLQWHRIPRTGTATAGPA
jgi:cellulose synthase/poly-beta-1,6-N-acetylglucosamine synthase-like glycosyltransferase/peptidoglycan/xylan/chitin deacetylase (PgdA/CDA1 family)